jgi:site-specific recombinase XerD
VKQYLEYLLERRLAPKTINEHLLVIRSFYRYLSEEEDRNVESPTTRKMSLRMAKPLPRNVRQSELDLFFSIISNKRDRAMFMLMLRCGLRVEEVTNLELGDIDYHCSQIMVRGGKGGKDRTTYFSTEAASALAAYLRIRPYTKSSHIFLVEKGSYRGKPLSVRGIQKRMEYYARHSGTSISCHRLRHTMATQLLNGGADIVTIQELLGHSEIELTMRYSRLSNLKTQGDYYRVMERLETQNDDTLAAEVPPIRN